MTSDAAPQVSVIVPWRPQKDRQPGWAWLKRWYSVHHPDWEIIEADCKGEWNKPTALNEGVDRARGSVLVVSDADVLPMPDSLPAAVSAAQKTGWVIPHGKVHRLRREPTQRILSQSPRRMTRMPHGPLVRPAYTGMPGGGLFVITKKNYLAAGGFDPGFVRWGVEDSAFGIAADTLLGKHVRYHHIPLIHLWHDPGKREVNPFYAQNVRRKKSYTAAKDNPLLMAELRGVPVPPVPVRAFSRPKLISTHEDWILYANLIGLDMPRSLYGNPRGFTRYVLMMENKLQQLAEESERLLNMQHGETSHYS